MKPETALHTEVRQQSLKTLETAYLFEAAEAAGLTTVKDLAEALISLRLKKGFGQFEGKVGAELLTPELTPLVVYALPEVINAVTNFDSDISVESLRSRVNYLDAFKQYELVDQEAAVADSELPSLSLETEVVVSAGMVDVKVKSPFHQRGTQTIEFSAYIQWQKPGYGLIQGASMHRLQHDSEGQDAVSLPLHIWSHVAPEFSVVVSAKNQQTGEVIRKTQDLVRSETPITVVAA